MGRRTHSWALMEQPQPPHEGRAERGSGWGPGGLGGDGRMAGMWVREPVLPRTLLATIDRGSTQAPIFTIFIHRGIWGL